MDLTLTEFMKEQLNLVSTDFKRYMYDKLPWEARLVGLMGPRGVGKSTMVLQHSKANFFVVLRLVIYPVGQSYDNITFT